MYSDLCYIFSRKDRFRFILLLILMLGGSGIELATLGAVPLYVSGVMGQLPPFLADYCSQEHFPLYGSLALLFLFFLRTIYFMCLHALQERILRNRQLALGSRIFRAYMNAPYALIRRSNSSQAINFIASESERLVCSLLDPVISLLRNGIVALSVLLLLLLFDSVVSISAFAVLALFGTAFMLLSRRRMERCGKAAAAARENAVKTTAEGIGAFKEALILGCRGYFCSRMHGAMEQQADSMRKVNTTQKNLWPAMEMLTVLVLIGTLALLILSGRTPQSIATTLALLTVSLARMKGTVTEILLFSSYIRYNSSVLKNVADELRRLESTADAAAESVEEKGSSMLFQDKISVEHVTFTYPDASAPVLKDISFEIARGASVGFIGVTGSGKTTMAELLLGLFAPDSGEIKADGCPIAENMAGWRNMLGYVPQDIYLLDDTIRANIALGIPEHEIDESALKKAISVAQLSEFVESLPQKESTLVGEHGTLLSGGQRQRIGIARALYRNPQIIVFDEATSALDNETEAALVQAIDSLRGTHTLIIVAHRLTTIASCNCVYVFSDGTIRKKE